MSARTSFDRNIGIVLVGTHPWNNSAFDRLLPRTLLPVAHRPLISYALQWLHDGGIQDVGVCANRETRTLQSALRRHVPRGLTVSYYEDQMPRGAAGAVRDAAAASDGDTFVVTDGTAIPNVDLKDLLTAHRTSGATVTVVVHSETARNSNPCLQVPSGIYIIDRQALDGVPATGFYDIKENLIPALYRAGERVVTYSAPAASPRVLDASSYLAVNEWMVERLVTAGEPPDGYFKSDNCLLHRDAVVADDVMFVGPVLVGPGARVMSGAVVVGPTSIGLGATIGPGVLVSRSAIWRRSFLGEQSIADRCIVADDVEVDSHTQAFRAVMVEQSRREPQVGRNAMPEIADVAPIERFRRMGRLLIETAWLKSAAPQ